MPPALIPSVWSQSSFRRACVRRISYVCSHCSASLGLSTPCRPQDLAPRVCAAGSGSWRPLRCVVVAPLPGSPVAAALWALPPASSVPSFLRFGSAVVWCLWLRFSAGSSLSPVLRIWSAAREGSRSQSSTGPFRGVYPGFSAKKCHQYFPVSLTSSTGGTASCFRSSSNLALFQRKWG